MDIALDIETMRNSAWIDKMPEVEVKLGNLKDAAKIQEKMEAAKKAQLEDMALSPFYGRVCAFVAIKEDDVENAIKKCITAETDAEETSLIEFLFKTISEQRVITYNGTNFDLPFIYQRAIMLGIDPREFNMPTLAEMTARYNNKHHVDVMTVWTGGGPKFEKLDNLGAAILGERKKDIDFREFPELIKTETGRTDLLNYCEQDVALTLRLWSRFSGILV